MIEREYGKSIQHMACGSAIPLVRMDVRCYKTSMCDYKEASTLSHGTVNTLSQAKDYGAQPKDVAVFSLERTPKC